MPLLYLLLMAVVQYVIVCIIYPEYESESFLLGNLQIILVIWIYQTATKYIKVWYESL